MSKSRANRRADAAAQEKRDALVADLLLMRRVGHPEFEPCPSCGTDTCPSDAKCNSCGADYDFFTMHSEGPVKRREEDRRVVLGGANE